MTVTPASRQILPLPTAGTPASRPAAETDRSFANLLRETLASGAELAAPLEVAVLQMVADTEGEDGKFNLALATDDDAVRFDARPLVGPASVPGEAGEAAEAAQPSTEIGRGAPIVANSPSLDSQAPARRGIDPGFGAGSAMPVGTERSLAQSSATPDRAPRVHRPGGFAVERSAAHHATSSETQPAAKPSAARQAASGRSTPLPTAMLTISPGEVLVTLRGVSLSRAEQDALIEQVRDLLATYHPGRRSIRIDELSRKV